MPLAFLIVFSVVSVTILYNLHEGFRKGFDLGYDHAVSDECTAVFENIDFCARPLGFAQSRENPRLFQSPYAPQSVTVHQHGLENICGINSDDIDQILLRNSKEYFEKSDRASDFFYSSKFEGELASITTSLSSNRTSDGLRVHLSTVTLIHCSGENVIIMFASKVDPPFYAQMASLEDVLRAFRLPPKLEAAAAL